MTLRVKRRLLLLACALVFLGTTGAGAFRLHRSRVASQAAHALAAGLEAEKAGDFPGALKNVSAYCSRFPNDGEAVLTLARLRLKVREVNDRHLITCVAYARAAASLLPGDLRPLELELDALGQAQFYTEQLDVAEQILAVAKDHHDALTAKAIALARTGDKRAQTAAEKLTEAFPNEVAGFQLLLAQKRKAGDQNLRESADAYARAHPNDISFLLLQAEVAFSARDIDGASDVVTKAAALKPSSASQVRELAVFLDSLAGLKPALAPLADQVIASAMQGPLGKDVAPIAAERAWKLGQGAEARRLARAGLADAPSGAADAALGWVAFLGEGTEDQDSAAALAQLRQRTTPEAGCWTSLVESRGALSQGNVVAAREALRVAGDSGALQSQNTLRDLVAFESAELNRQLGEWRSEADLLRELCKRDPAWSAVSLSLISLLQQHGELDEAAKVACACLRPRIAKEDAVAIAGCLAARLEAGHAESEQVDAAASLIGDLERQSSDDPVVLALAVRTFVALGKAEEAAARAGRLEQIYAQNAPGDATPLVDAAAALRRVDASKADALEARAREIESVAAPSAVLSAQQVKETKRRLGQEVERAGDGPAKVGAQLRLASFLDSVSDPRAGVMLARLCEEHPSDPSVQSAMLESHVAWEKENKEACAKAIARLRELSGDDAARWRIHQARWYLRFTPDRESAKQVASVLNPVIVVDPHDAEARALSAEGFVLLGEPASAISELSAAVDAGGAGVVYYPRLIELLDQAGRNEEAARRLTLFARVPLTSVALRRERARLLERGSMWDQAASEYAALEPLGDIDDAFGWARVAAKLGDRQQVRTLVAKLSASPRADERMIAFCADFLTAESRTQEAEALLAAAPASATPERRLYQRAAYFERHGRSGEAEAAYRELAAGGSAKALADLARFYLKARRLTEASEAIQRAREVDAKDADVLKVGGLIRIAAGDATGQGFDELAAALESDGSSASWRALTRALQTLDRTKELGAFAAEVEQITRTDPAFVPAWNLLVMALWQDGQLEKAVKMVQAAARSAPNSPAVARQAAQVFGAAGQFLGSAEMNSQALAMARRWRELTLNDPFEADLAICRLLGDGHADQALRVLEPWARRIASEADQSPGNVELYARVLAENQKYQEAQELLWSRAQTDRAWALSFFRVGANLSDAGASREWLSRVEPLLVNDGEGLLTLGRAWTRLWMRVSERPGSAEQASLDRARAIDLLRRAMNDPAKRGEAAQQLGEIAHRGGDFAEAERCYRVAIQEHPDNAAALNNLSILLRDSPATLAESIGLARRAVDVALKLRPVPKQCRSFYETLASALMKDGRYQEAEKAYREGLKLDPAATDLIVGLADSELRQERRKDAQEVLRRLDSIDSRGTASMNSDLLNRLVALRQTLAQSEAK
jgi:tetratricopeptide (TPR) repeat protein